MLDLLDRLEKLGVRAEVGTEYAELFDGNLTDGDEIILTFPDGKKFTLIPRGEWGYNADIEVKREG